MVTHGEMIELVIDYMKALGYHIVKSSRDSRKIPRNRAYPDGVFAKGDLHKKGRRIGSKSAIIVECKAGDKPLDCLEGIGQLLYYSTLMGMDNICLVIPQEHLQKLEPTLDRLPWLNVLVVNSDKRVVSKRWTLGLYSLSSFREFNIPQSEIDID